MKVLILSLLGLCFGSFVNAFVWRLHELETRKKLSKAEKEKLSIVHGRSICTHCHHELVWYDLLPVISWVLLRGKCRYCHKPIGWQYPVVEALTAVLFAISFIYWPYGFEAAGWTLFGLWLIFLVGFMALIVYDLRWMLLPNKIVYGLVGLAIVQLVPKIAIEGSASEVIGGAFWGFMTIGGLFYVLFQVSGGKWIGGGDVKLAFMIGILVGGPLNSMLVLFVSSVLGTIASLPLLVNKKLRLNSHIPFGPFLLAATIIVYLFAARLTDWYLNSLT